MEPLDRSLRSKLENTIKSAREIAEAGAKAALEQLGVGLATPDSHLSEAEKGLRRRLRAHGRQLGDSLNGGKIQSMERLIQEVAYEHWHRMLFARFLAENNLLMYPDPVEPVAVSLDECEEMAADEGARNGWELAARYAARMLPQIFRQDSPVFEIVLPPEHQRKMDNLLAGLSKEVFSASDSLGWVYQFWRANEKDAVNLAGEKINADTISAVTQLFTEHYMVEFLLHNTLGAWWATKVEAAGCTSPIPLPFLRHKDDGSPAAGAFPGWPKAVRDLRALDPCCGSGHFLVALLELIVAMLREEEKLGAEEAVRVVLRDILHGLEIDARCTQLAAFNVAFAAWKIIGRPVDLPPLHIACSGLSVGATREEWIDAVEKEDRFLIGQLYDLFKKAPELGSLINPAQLSNIGRKASDLLPALRGLLAADPLANPERHELGVTAAGLAHAVETLAGQFTLVATNVPYLGRGKQEDTLQDFCDKYHTDARSDLATAFIERSLAFCTKAGTAALVTPQNWLFQGTYQDLRKHLLKQVRWDAIVRLGPRAFETITGEVVNVALLVLTRAEPPEEHKMLGIDVAEQKIARQKAKALLEKTTAFFGQSRQLSNPDAKIVFAELTDAAPLGRVATSFQGLKTGDDGYFRKNFWELPSIEEFWLPFQSTVSVNTLYSGKESILRYEHSGAEIARNQGTSAWGKIGVAVSQMSALPSTIFLGDAFDSNVAPIILDDCDILPALWAFCSSPKFVHDVRNLDAKVAVANGTFAKVPFDLAYWQSVAAEKYPNGLPKPHSDDPTQWLFNGHPCGSEQPLQVAVARLLGYRWPRQTGSEFPDCPALGSDGLEGFADKDGIVCIPPVRGEVPAADRLLNLLAAAYGKNWNSSTLGELLAQADHAGKTLETWLRDKFFLQHCKLFHQRPFVWHVWDGLRDGFSALINYHKLDAKLLETLIYTYLNDWMSRQKQDIANGVDGAQEKLAAAENLKKRLELIRQGEPPYDIFVRWKPIEQQPIGWAPDLNDGVRLNIRPFMTAEVLRFNKKPQLNISWEKDRGKDVASAPWYHLFNGDRINNHHLTRAEKETARAKAKEKQHA